MEDNMLSQQKILDKLKLFSSQPEVEDGKIKRIGLTNFNDDILDLLLSLNNINILLFYNVRFKKGALKKISQINGVHTLGFPSCNIEDSDILELAGMKDLKKVSILATNVTETGVKCFSKVVPNVQVIQA